MFKGEPIVTTQKQPELYWKQRESRMHMRGRHPADVQSSPAPASRKGNQHIASQSEL